MSFTILTENKQVEPYIGTVQHMADLNRRIFGFIPRSSFRDQANNGRLWIAIDPDNGQFAGYLLFGGKHPTLKIFQIFVHKQYRKKSLGSYLLSAIRKLCRKEQHFIYLRASSR